MRKPTNLNAYMLHHKPYRETWKDWALATVIGLIFACLMFSYFDFSLFRG